MQARPLVTLLGTLLPIAARTVAQEAEPFRGAPGLISLPAGNVYGLDLAAKAPGADAAVPSMPVGTAVDFRAAAILGGAPLELDAISVGLDWVISDADGRIPAARTQATAWSWAAVLFSVSASTVGIVSQHDTILRERSSPGGAGGDVFSLTIKGSLIPGTSVPLPENRVELAVDSPEISVYRPGQLSEIDGYDLFGVLYLYDGLRPFLPPPAVYFSLTRASMSTSGPLWGVAPADWSGATVFRAVWDETSRTWSTPKVYRSPASLGLASTDDVDALAVDTIHLFDHGGEEYILFSLVPGPSVPPLGTGVSFARSGAEGSRPYRYSDQPGGTIDEAIGRGVNVDAICSLDPGRDWLLEGRVFAVPTLRHAAFPPTGPSTVWLAPNPTFNGPDLMRTMLWSPGCPPAAPDWGVVAFTLPNTLTVVASQVVSPALRNRSSGGVPLRGCPATVDVPLPAGFDLAGLGLDFWWADANLATSRLALAVPKQERPCVAGFSLAEGNPGTTGAMDVEWVDTNTAGSPVSQGLGLLAFQPITHYGWKGYRELVGATFVATAQADMDVDRGDSVCQDLRNPSAPHMSLPNGFDLYVCRDPNDSRAFFLASLDRRNGSLTRLSGSTIGPDQGASSTPVSMFRPQFAFTRDGRTGVCIVHDSTNSPVGNQGPQDRILVFKTDPAERFANGRNVFDASPPYVQPGLLHTAYNGSLRLGTGGVGLVEGEEPSGTSGAAALWGGPTDGSAIWSRIPVPNTGTNQPFYWSYSVWRHSADGSTDVFLNGGNPSSSATEVDVMAIRNLGSGTPVVVDITQFPYPTQVQPFGNSTLGGANLRGALSPDGSRFAFVIGGNAAASPGNVCIARTDGSDAGAVLSFTQGRFPSQIVTFAELWWLSDQVLLFSASDASAPNGDLWAYDLPSGQVVNLTQSGGVPGNLAVHGSFLAEDGRGYYFLRGHATTATGLGTDWKRIDTTTLQVTDITGNEFSGGSAPSLRPVSTSPYTWQPRRDRVSGELVFASGRNLFASSLFTDDEIFRFDPGAGTQAVQLTANNGVSSSTATVQRVQDLTLAPRGSLIAWAQGIGTSSAIPEDLFVMPLGGGGPRQVSRTPPSGGQGIAAGTLVFTSCPVGIGWVQGDNSRTSPTTRTAAFWADLSPARDPLRLTAPPSAVPKSIMLMGADLLER